MKTSHSFWIVTAAASSTSAGSFSCLGDAAREREVDALDCVDGDLGESVGVLLGGDLDLDATLYRAHGQVVRLVRSSRKEM